ncbi:diguanylate cyclase [Paracraurococcus lichenis]|uniref:diguanylate cyclase n=1 Tax=Paracraurococcus lichenis TaxID=3064888 RepID=A0ABT9E7Q3_9PROT|nr:diguanylate cyclase [Paracraurococcus sp. LOR1-02]MDO9712203.1 diguanylate cyclase [Paracraurococcus sp. LOR1-02]
MVEVLAGAAIMNRFAPALARLTGSVAPAVRLARRRPVFLGLLLSASVLVVMVAALLDARRDAWARASDASANLARALERDLSSEVRSIDLALQAVADTMAYADGERISPEFRRLLIMQQVGATRYLDAVLLLDDDGEVAFDSRQDAPAIPADLTDRDYFAAHRDRADLGLFVSKPFRSRRAGGQWTIGFSRRLSRPDGSFAGIVLGVIRLTRLQATFEDMQLGPRGSMTLLRDDGLVLARTPFDERNLGRDLSHAPAFRRAQQAGVQQFVAISIVDGVERFYTQRHFEGVPLFINVALAVHDVYSAWRRKAAVIGGVTLLLVGAMAVLLIRLHRELGRRQVLEQAARSSETAFRLLTENSGDGVCRLDAGGRRLYTSPASEAIFGRPAEELVGRHLLDDVSPEDVSVVRDAIARLREGETTTRIEYRIVLPDLEQVWVETSLRAILNPVTGRAEGIIAVKRDVTERKALEGRLAALARTDGLTGLSNRRAFDEALALEWSRARRESTPVSLLLLDVDRFKLFNDTYGHPAGDACLRAVAGAVAAAVHRPADLVARYGGEEIVVLLPNTSAAGAEMLAEQVRAAVEAVGLKHTANLPLGVVTVSVGAATALPAADPDLFAEALVAAADAALYSAKHSGRNRVAVAASVPPPAALPPVPAEEEVRLAAVAAYEGPWFAGRGKEELDRVTRLAAALLGTPIAAISLVGEDWQEFVSRVGLEQAGTPKDISFCGHLVASDEEILVVPNAALDPRFSANPLVASTPGIRFYAGAPLVCPLTGQRLGSLCIIDQVPRPALNPSQRALLADLAALAVDALAHRRAPIAALV